MANIVVWQYHGPAIFDFFILLFSVYQGNFFHGMGLPVAVPCFTSKCNHYQQHIIFAFIFPFSVTLFYPSGFLLRSHWPGASHVSTDYPRQENKSTIPLPYSISSNKVESFLNCVSLSVQAIVIYMSSKQRLNSEYEFQYVQKWGIHQHQLNSIDVDQSPPSPWIFLWQIFINCTKN